SPEALADRPSGTDRPSDHDAPCHARTHRGLPPRLPRAPSSGIRPLRTDQRGFPPEPWLASSSGCSRSRWLGTGGPIMRQITVLLDNHTGALADVTLALAERRINIDAIVCDAVEAHGVIRLSVDRYDDALVALRDAGFQAISEEALVLRLPDQPGALAKVAVLLKNAGIVVQSM